jgi:hypothetical protein
MDTSYEYTSQKTVTEKITDQPTKMAITTKMLKLMTSSEKAMTSKMMKPTTSDMMVTDAGPGTQTQDDDNTLTSEAKIIYLLHIGGGFSHFSNEGVESLSSVFKGVFHFY